MITFSNRNLLALPYILLLQIQKQIITSKTHYMKFMQCKFVGLPGEIIMHRRALIPTKIAVTQTGRQTM